MTNALADRIRNTGTGRFRSGPPAEAEAPVPVRPVVKGQPATPAQVRYLGVLLAERVGGEAAVIARKLSEGTISKRDASDAITALKALPKRQGEYRSQGEPEGPTVAPGLYTLETAEGHRTLKVTYQPSDARFAPGQTVLAYLSGSDNEGDYTSFAFIKPGPRIAVWRAFADSRELVADAERFLANPEAALTAKLCARCGRTLTTPESIELGIGPECRKRGW